MKIEDGGCPSLRTANCVTRLCKSAPAKLSIEWPPSLRFCHIHYNITARERHSVYEINSVRSECVVFGMTQIGDWRGLREIGNVITSNGYGQPPRIYFRRGDAASTEIGEYDDRQPVVWKTRILRTSDASMRNHPMAAYLIHAPAESVGSASSLGRRLRLGGR